jgi:hypothetical protein
MSDAAVTRAALNELTAVQEETAPGGWTDRHLERALGATRIVAAGAIGRKANQTHAPSATTDDGRLIAAGARRKDRAALSSSTTAEAVAGRLEKLSESADAAERQLLTDLHASLASFTAAQYSRDSNGKDRATLDAALGRAVEAARRLNREHAWPRAQVRRWRARRGEADPRA